MYEDADENSMYTYAEEDDEETYMQERYIPLAQRRSKESGRLARLRTRSRREESPSEQDVSNREDTLSGFVENREGETSQGAQRSKQILLKEARELRVQEGKNAKSEEQIRAEEEQKILEAHTFRGLAALENARRILHSASCPHLRAALGPCKEVEPRWSVLDNAVLGGWAMGYKQTSRQAVRLGIWT